MDISTQRPRFLCRQVAKQAPLETNRMWLDGPLRNPTFGVELELIIRHVPPQNGLRDLYRPCIREELRQYLEREGVAVHGGLGGAQDYSVWVVSDDGSINPYVDGDDNIHSKVTRSSVELISRVLQVGNEGFQEVRKVVGLIRAKFDVLVNRTTGLHVHVGNGSEGFNDQCIQNLAQLVTVFQHQIDSIHPDSRLEEYYAMPPSSNPYLNISKGPFAAAGAIQMDDRQTVVVMNPGNDRSMAYNFTNLADPSSGSKRTIEFRQHQGSVNAGQIVAWAEFVTALVSYCHSIPPERFLKLMLTFATDKDFSVLHLMQIIGKPHLVDFYRDKLVRRQRPKIALPNPSLGNSRR